MNEVLVTAPSRDPITLAEAKDHMRVNWDTDDAYIAGLIRVATEKIEHDTHRALMEQTWNFYLDEFPSRVQYIEIPKPPLSSITEIYYTISAAATEWASSNYVVDTYSLVGRVILAEGSSFPNHDTIPNAIRIKAVCGYGSFSDVPETLRHAIKWYVSHLFNEREPLTEAPRRELPLGIKNAINQYEVFTV